MGRPHLPSGQLVLRERRPEPGLSPFETKPEMAAALIFTGTPTPVALEPHVCAGA